MHLKVVEVRADPAPVHDHDVPVMLASVGLPRPGRRPPRPPPAPAQPPADGADQCDPDIDADQPFQVDFNADWDLTTRQVLQL